MDVKDTVALVTGGGSGLGAETCRMLAEQGARVVVLDVTHEKAQKVAKEIKGFPIGVDVTNANAVEKAFLDLKETWGIPRICVNCAGIIDGGRVVGREGPMNLEHFQRIINVNLIGTFNVLRIAAFYMTSLVPKEDTKETGVIINTASVAAFEGQLGQAAYSASKGGVASMTLPIARELASYGIRVVCIAPGVFETAMIEKLSDPVKQGLLSSTVFPKRLGYPEEFAKLVLHIIDNPMLNGSIIRLDGAARMPIR